MIGLEDTLHAVKCSWLPDWLVRKKHGRSVATLSPSFLSPLGCCVNPTALCSFFVPCDTPQFTRRHKLMLIFSNRHPCEIGIAIIAYLSFLLLDGLLSLLGAEPACGTAIIFAWRSYATCRFVVTAKPWAAPASKSYYMRSSCELSHEFGSTFSAFCSR